MTNDIPSGSVSEKQKSLNIEQLKTLAWRTSIALETSGIGVWDYNIYSHELVWDDCMLHIYGISAHEFPNTLQDWLKRIHSEDQESVTASFNNCIESKKDFKAVFRIHWPDNSIRFIKAKARLVLNERTQSLSFVGTNTDITDRKVAEQEIRKLSSIARQTDNVVVITNVAGEIEWVNQAFTKCSGYSLEEVIGIKPGAILQGPETDPETVLAIRKALLERVPCQFEILNYNKAGMPYWIELRINPILDEYGKIQGFIALEMDISDRKETELKLVRQQDMLESMSSQGSIGAWELDLVKEKIFWSNMTKKIHEVPPDFEPILETSVNFYKQGYSRDTIARLVASAIETGTPWNEELQLITAKGNEIWVNATGQAEFKGGKCTRLYGSFQDIEQRKRSHDELTRAKEVAESAAKAKSQFLASMSHEIRTPMNGVLGMLSLMMRDDLSPLQKHRAKLAKASAESLLTIINEILDFSKVEAGKLELELIDFNLNNMLADFSETIVQRFEEKNIELILDTTTLEQSMVQGDPGRLRQILTNLVGNALKFTAKGNILIRASLTKQANQHYRFKCDIEDTGIGIPFDKIAKLFDPFSQVDVTTTRKYGGTGLGLSIVKELCHLMGGDITVSSEDGKGSCFRINVELFPSDLVHIDTSPNLDHAQILIVDKNPSTRKVIASQLKQWGAKTEEAESSSQALNLVEHAEAKDLSFDIVIIDSKDQDMSYELIAKKIKSKLNNYVHVILMTNTQKANDIKSIQVLGFDAALSKPATRENLTNAFAKCLHPNDQSQFNIVDTSNNLDYSSNAACFSLDSRLLVVEDNFINQEIAKGMLENMGLSCDLASNGQEALDALIRTSSDTPYDLIIMDCQMPEMDGYEASQHIRAGKAGARNKNIPIIAITANAIKGDKEICLAAGMSDYLSKPLNPTSLKKMLSDWLQTSKSTLQTASDVTAPAVEPSLVLANLPEDNNILKYPVWDYETALKRLNSNEELLIKVISMFVNDLPGYQQKIHEAIASNDYETAARISHSIKGIAANIGADSLANFVAKLELICDEGNRLLINNEVSIFETECQAIHDILNNYIQSH